VRRLTFICVMASAVTILGGYSAAYAQTSSLNQTVQAGKVEIPQTHYGTKCVTVKSKLGWKGKICAIINASDITGGYLEQGLFTFSISSGNIKNVSAVGMYLRQCSNALPGDCDSVAYTDGPSKNTSGTSAYLSTKWEPAPGSSYQARINTPCLTWASKGQYACYKGVLKSASI
jgi:hypothetical protein